MGMTKVARLSELPEGAGHVVSLNGTPVALFKVDGKVFAIENTCVHRGGPLGDGSLEGPVVTCPWHGWRYDVTSGECVEPGTVRVAAYKVEIKGDDIYLDA